MLNSHKNKTVVDAVNYSKGSHEGLRGGGFGFVSYWDNGFFKCDKGSIAFDKGLIICTADEFNQCLAEMSEGLFVPDCRPKMDEIKYNHNDDGFDIGGLYEFSDTGAEWKLSVLERVGPPSGEHIYFALGCGWKMIRVASINPRLGKIHKKPINLVDGAAYQFNVDGDTFVGLYTAEYDLFQNNTSTYEATQCTNIIKLVPESV